MRLALPLQLINNLALQQKPENTRLIDTNTSTYLLMLLQIAYAYIAIYIVNIFNNKDVGMA